MAAIVDNDFSIIIDDFKFTLISKTVPDEKAYYYDILQQEGYIEDRKKVMFNVFNKYSNDFIGTYNVYTSVSELGVWRLCFLDPLEYIRIHKFDNYIQATLIDIRLQVFINSKFNLLPFVSMDDSTGKRLKNVDRLLNYLETTLTRSQFEERVKAFTYTENNPNGTIGCSKYTDKDRNSINNRYIILFRSDTQLIEEKSKFLEENYNLIENSYVKITNYFTKLDNFNAYVEIYEIGATKKNESILDDIPPYIIFQVGKFELDVINSETPIHRDGYYIFNIRLPESKINQYGLYDKYISGTYRNPLDPHDKEQNYITKPLNYINQPSGDNYRQVINSGTEIENINSFYYFFTAYKNIIQFPIKQIIMGFTEPLPNVAVQDNNGGSKKYKRSKRNKKSKKSKKSKKRVKKE